jgi:hypothetical protein
MNRRIFFKHLVAISAVCAFKAVAQKWFKPKSKFRIVEASVEFPVSHDPVVKHLQEGISKHNEEMRKRLAQSIFAPTPYKGIFE